MVDSNFVVMVEIERIDDELFLIDVNNYCCCLDVEVKMEIFQEFNKVVQRLEYYLWEGQKENLEKRVFVFSELSKVDGGDYIIFFKFWDVV